MGEKETVTGAELRESPTRQSLGREAGSGMATGREAGSGMATGREQATGRATGRAEGGVTHEDTWDQQGSAATGDVDSDGSPDEMATRVLKQKTKSNQSNDRLDVDDDGGTAEAAIVKSKSNITNN